MEIDNEKITYVRNEIYGYKNGVPQYLVQISLKSSETKPTANIVHGSTAIEEDTGNFSIFDGTNWNKMCTIKEEE